MSAPGKAAPLAVGALVLALLPAGASAQARQLELGVESFAYRSATTPLNRDNVLGLDAYPGLSRFAVGWRETHGSFLGLLSRLRRADVGHAGRRDRLGRPAGLRPVLVGRGRWGLRLGKQRIAWGSGFAWNPTNRLEPPKNARNTTLEQEGALAARLDWAPRRGRASFSSARRPTRLLATCRWSRAKPSAATPSPSARASW